MATHDYVIDNSTGANVRADINSVLQAILTNNSSSSAPSTTAAYMFWADTTSGTLKIRNSSDNAWVELLQLDGTLTLEDGSVSTPALAFRDDLNTGIFSSAADTFNVATAGVERMELGATTIFNEDGADVDFRIEGDTDVNNFYLDAGNNAIGIGTSTPLVPDGSNADNPNNGKVFTIYGDSPAINLIHNTTGGSAASDDYSAINFGRTGSTTNPYRAIIGYKQSDDILRINSNNEIAFDIGTIGTNEVARIESNGRFLVGSSSSKGIAGGNSKIQIQAIDSTGRISIVQNRNEASGAPFLSLAKTRGTSVNSNTLVQNGDNLGTIAFAGGDGTDVHSTAVQIVAQVDSTAAANDMPGRLVFFTTPDGSDSPAERMRIDSSGNVGIGATPNELLHIAKSGTAKLKIEDLRTVISNDSEFATIQFAQKDSNADGVSFEMAATMTDSDNGSCALVFKNNRPSAFAERMRIDSLFFLMGCTSPSGGTSSGVLVQEYLGHVYNAIKLRDTANTGSANAMVFVTGSSTVGSIVQTGSSTSYNTSSDYRLKENETEITDGITRLKLLKPYKFNWKRDPDTRVDGFFAHEAQDVVPEAVTGKKDEIADCDIEGKGITKGQKIYQQMDNAKLIPVLTAAIKEAVNKIEVLETKVAALEAA